VAAVVTLSYNPEATDQQAEIINKAHIPLIAGLAGNNRARIFCRKLQAELLAIDGVYQTADDMPAALIGKPVQAWLDGEQMKMTVLD